MKVLLAGLKPGRRRGRGHPTKRTFDVARFVVSLTGALRSSRSRRIGYADADIRLSILCSRTRRRGTRGQDSGPAVSNVDKRQQKRTLAN